MLSLETKFIFLIKIQIFARLFARAYMCFRFASPKSTAQILTAKTSNRHDLL